MATMPASKPAMPFTPTVDPDGNPSVCHCCGRHAIGVGFGDPSKGDPKYLCRECVVIIEYIKSVRRLDFYELQALDGGVDAVGEWISNNGGITELAHYDELMQRMLVKAAWTGCVDRLRKLLRENEAPF